YTRATALDPCQRSPWRTRMEEVRLVQNKCARLGVHRCSQLALVKRRRCYHVLSPACGIGCKRARTPPASGASSPCKEAKTRKPPRAGVNDGAVSTSWGSLVRAQYSP